MGFLRGFALALISIILFLSLLLLGAGVTANFTVLNPGFFKGQVEDLNVTGLIREAVYQSAWSRDLPRAAHEFLDQELPKYSEELKAAVEAAVDRLYDYLLGRTDPLDLEKALGETVLDPELIYSLAEKINWPELADELVQRELTGDLDPTFSYLADYIDDAMVKLEPWFHETLRDVVPPMQDYILGQSQDLNLSISLEEPAFVLYQTLLDVYNRFPPPELAGLSPEQKLLAFNSFFFFELIPNFPISIEIDSSFIGGTPESINQGLDILKTGLSEAKTAVSRYWAGFYFAIAFIAALVALVFVIRRNVSRSLFFTGMVFFAFGLFGFVSVMVANSVISPATDFGFVNLGSITLQYWLPGFVENAVRPFMFFSIGAGIFGIAAIVASLVLNPHHESTK